MERAEGIREMFSLSIGTNGIRSDLVQKLMKQSRNHDGSERDEGDEELELSLGLSMNGRFGVDPARKRLKRSSSISNLVFAVGAADNGSCSHQAREVEEFDAYAPLSRTRSLPTEVEEEWRRRKEFQSMRRMEARKKRMEKLRNVRVQKDKENCCENGNGFHEAVNKNSIDTGIINKFENGNEISSSQGSIGSRSGSGSSGISDLEFEGGMSQKADIPPPATRPSQDQNNPESARETGPAGLNPPNKSLKNAMFEMPYVSTKENGPDGHKIEGFLYSHKKGEDVRIVCVCHGTFLTPAEFVKHGGGGDDVEHPLKHIVVNPFPLL